jgi:hypothetical protein
MAEHDLHVLRQQDLSHLSVRDMNPAERTELCRRYVAFIAHFGVPTAAPAPPPHVRKWVPEKRIERRSVAGR